MNLTNNRKGEEDDFAGRFRGRTVLPDKAYVDQDLSEEMRSTGVNYTAIKRKNMIKGADGGNYYRTLSRIRRMIETMFSQLEEYRLRFIKAASRRD